MRKIEKTLTGEHETRDSERDRPARSNSSQRESCGEGNVPGRPSQSGPGRPTGLQKAELHLVSSRSLVMLWPCDRREGDMGRSLPALGKAQGPAAATILVPEAA